MYGPSWVDMAIDKMLIETCKRLAREDGKDPEAWTEAGAKLWTRYQQKAQEMFIEFVENAFMKHSNRT